MKYILSKSFESPLNENKNSEMIVYIVLLSTITLMNVLVTMVEGNERE